MSAASDDRATAWVRSILGDRSFLGDPLDGGVTSHVQLVHSGDLTAVLKRVTSPDWLDERPDVIAYEARVLDLMADTPVPVPPVLAVDPTGAEAGDPALLLGHVAALPAATAPEPTDVIDGLAEIALAIAAVPAPAWVRPFRRYLEPGDASPPPWSRDREAWECAIRIVSAAPPATPTTLIHRDFHPWNVLWDGGVVAVVDWSQTSVGPIAVDVAHCRMNLVIGGDASAADAYCAAWEARAGVSHDPYWDLVTVIDLLPDWRPADRENGLLDRHVRALVDLIG